MIYGISMILALVAFCLGCRLFLVYRAIRSIKKQLKPNRLREKGTAVKGTDREYQP